MNEPRERGPNAVNGGKNSSDHRRYRIGKATALGLAARGARVAITGRDAGRAARAAAEIRAVASAPVDVFVADLSSQQDVRSLACDVLRTLDRLDVLVNNVGGFWNTRRVTVDGLEYTFALNHLAPFLLTNLLVERLKEGSPARVVTVSSGAQAMGRMDFADLQAEQSYSGQRAYNQSKLANVLFTYGLASRLASATALENVTGRYFANSKPKRSSKRSYSQADADRLWQVSMDLVGLESDSERSTIHP